MSQIEIQALGVKYQVTLRPVPGESLIEVTCELPDVDDMYAAQATVREWMRDGVDVVKLERVTMSRHTITEVA